MAEYQAPMPGGGRVDPPRVEAPSAGTSLAAAIDAGAISADPVRTAERATEATPGIGDPPGQPAQQQGLLMNPQLQSGQTAYSRPTNLELGLPIVFTRNISLDINKVTVDFCIKKLSCTRMDEVDLMEIKAILCFDPVLTRNIVNKRISPHVDYNRVNHCSQKVITAENILLDEIGGLYKFEDPTTSSVFYDIPFSVVFDISEIDGRALTEENPEHLSCVVFPFVRTNPSIPDGTESYQSVGNMKCDLVFDNSELSSQSNLLSRYSSPHMYTNPVWTRGVTRISDPGRPERLVQGTPDTVRSLTEALDLRSIGVPNSKVRDFRVINKDLPDFEPPAEVTTESSTANFSDLYLSHDHEKNVRILFGIDCAEIYRRNVKFYKLIDNPRASSQVMDQVRINRLEVFRRNTTDDSPRELVIDSDDFSTVPQFSSAASARASIRETHLQGGTPTGGKYRFFSITDKEISDFTSGRYEYSIEIEFEDKTETWFAGRNRVLREQMEDLRSLMADLDVPGGFPLENLSMGRFSADFINGPSAPGAIEKLRRYINIYINNLSLLFDITDSQRRELVRTLTIITHPVTGNLQGMGSLKVLMNKLITKNNTILETVMALNNEATDSPSDGSSTPESNTFTVKKVYSRNEDLYDLTCSSNVGINYLYTSEVALVSDSTPTKSGPATIGMAEWQALVNRESSKYPGISQAATVRGLDSTFEYVPGTNQNSFLSPNYIRVSDNIIQFPISESDVARMMAANALLLQRAEDHLYSDTNEPEYQTFSPDAGGATLSVRQTLGRNSILFSEPTEAEKVLVHSSVFLAEAASPSETESLIEEAGEYLGTDSPFNEEGSDRARYSDSATPDLNLPSEEGKYIWLMNGILEGVFSGGQSEAAARTNEKLNLQNENNLIDTFSQAELAAIPNHIVALAANTPSSFLAGDPIRFLRYHRNEARFNIEYNTLHRVEILSQFGAGIKDPIWIELTDEALDNIQGTVLARIIHYTNPSLGVEDKFRCPVYNEYFLLGDTEVRSSTPMLGQEISSDISINGRYVFPEYIEDYTSLLEPIRSTPPPPASTSPYKPAGTTSRHGRGGHRHEYELDENGNGIAREVCKRGRPNVCHTHQVVNFVVKPAESLSISMEHGVPMHVHDLEERG